MRPHRRVCRDIRTTDRCMVPSHLIGRAYCARSPVASAALIAASDQRLSHITVGGGVTEMHLMASHARTASNRAKKDRRALNTAGLMRPPCDKLALEQNVQREVRSAT